MEIMSIFNCIYMPIRVVIFSSYRCFRGIGSLEPILCNIPARWFQDHMSEIN